MFDEKIVKEYALNNEQSKGFYTWWSFIDEKSDLATSLGFAKFFCPDMLEVDGCYVLKHRYDAKTFNEWKESGLTYKELEVVTNMYEVTDFFNRNLEEYEKDNYSEMIDALGEALQYFWSLTLKDRYPDIPLVVDLFEDYEYEEEGREYAALIITIYTERL